MGRVAPVDEVDPQIYLRGHVPGAADDGIGRVRGGRFEAQAGTQVVEQVVAGAPVLRAHQRKHAGREPGEAACPPLTAAGSTT